MSPKGIYINLNIIQNEDDCLYAGNYVLQKRNFSKNMVIFRRQKMLNIKLQLDEIIKIVGLLV